MRVHSGVGSLHSVCPQCIVALHCTRKVKARIIMEFAIAGCANKRGGDCTGKKYYDEEDEDQGDDDEASWPRSGGLC